MYKKKKKRHSIKNELYYRTPRPYIPANFGSQNDLVVEWTIRSWFVCRKTKAPFNRSFFYGPVLVLRRFLCPQWTRIHRLLDHKAIIFVGKTTIQTTSCELDTRKLYSTYLPYKTRTSRRTFFVLGQAETPIWK